MSNREPFYMLPQSLAARRDLSASAKIVCAVIVNRMGQKDVCWPSIRTLAKDSGLCSDTAGKAIGQLEKAGLITIERGKYRKPNRYRLGTGYVLKTSTCGKSVCTENQGSDVLKTSTSMYRKSVSNKIKKDQLNKNHKNNGDFSAPPEAVKIKKGKSKPAKPKFDPLAITIPEKLDTPEFREAWREWISHRAEIRKPLTKRATEITLKQLAPFGPGWAVNRIQQAISNGWQGLVFQSDSPANETNPAKPGEPPKPRMYAVEAAERVMAKRKREAELARESELLAGA